MKFKQSKGVRRATLLILVLSLLAAGWWLLSTTEVGVSLLPRETGGDNANSGLSTEVSSTVPIDVSTPAEAEASEVSKSGPAATHPLEPVLGLAEEILQTIQSQVVDYTAVLVKRERINGSLGPLTRMNLKVRTRGENRERPLSVYLKFLEPSSAKGREVIWIEGENENKITVHEGGFKNLLRLQLEPTGRLAMLGNKYPITEIGLTRLVEKLIEKGNRDKLIGRCRVDVIDGQRVGDRPCQLIQVTHPELKPGLDFHIAQIFVDSERKVPLRYAAFMWPNEDAGDPVLEEEYTYLNLQLNVGLSDIDFDPDNPEYDFP